MSEKYKENNTDKRVVRTKKAIKTALFKLMEQKDISSISVSELAKTANVNRRTFYTHYKNITDILDEIEEELVTALSGLVSKFDTHDYKTSTYNVFMGLNGLITVEFEYYFHLIRVDMRGVLMTRLKAVIKASTDRLLKDIGGKYGQGFTMLSAFIVGGFFNTYLEWHNNPGNMTPERAAELTSSIVAMCIQQAREGK